MIIWAGVAVALAVFVAVTEWQYQRTLARARDDLAGPSGRDRVGL